MSPIPPIRRARSTICVTFRSLRVVEADSARGWLYNLLKGDLGANGEDKFKFRSCFSADGSFVELLEDMGGLRRDSNLEFVFQICVYVYGISAEQFSLCLICPFRTGRLCQIGDMILPRWKMVPVRRFEALRNEWVFCS